MYNNLFEAMIDKYEAFKKCPICLGALNADYNDIGEDYGMGNFVSRTFKCSKCFYDIDGITYHGNDEKIITIKDYYFITETINYNDFQFFNCYYANGLDNYYQLIDNALPFETIILKDYPERTEINQAALDKLKIIAMLK